MGLTLSVVGSLAPAAASRYDYGRAIDVAGRQRMLTQRIVKAYCQVGMNVLPEVSRAQLDRAVRLFDDQLAQLRRGVPTPEARAALRKVVRLWRPFRAVATGRASRSGAQRLAELNDELLEAAHAVVLALVQAAGTSEARLVNISGRQRMLSQRLAKLYMLRAWEFDTPLQRQQMETAASEFAESLEVLQKAPENTPEIRRELEAVERQWEWFTSAITLQGAQSYTLVVADASESILNSMDLITGLYAALARD